MGINFKIWIDKFIGFPLLYILGIFYRLFNMNSDLEHQGKELNSELTKTILITKYQGMGSLVIASPAIKKMRQCYPKAKIIFWGTPSTTELAKLMPEFDEIRVLDDRNIWTSFKSFLYNIYKFRSQKIDCCFDLEVYSNLAALLSTFIGAKRRFGFVLGSTSPRQYVYTDLVYFNRNYYLGEAYWKLFAVSSHAIFGEVSNEDFPAWKINLNTEVSKQLPARPYIVININSSDLSLERKWPTLYFEYLVKKILTAAPQLDVVLIGHGHAEEMCVQDFMNHERIIKLAGKLNLSELFIYLKRSELVISNDSGPLHFASALGVKLIGIFGPTKPENYFSEKRHLNHIMIRQEIYCSPCVHHWDRPPCLGDNKCMKTLSWQLVWLKVAQVLNLDINSGDQLEDILIKSEYYPGRFKMLP